MNTQGGADEDQGRAAGAPTVSVVIPVFNRPEQVGEAVESALAQDHLHTEVVVVDDGSTDESPSVVAALAEADPRVKSVLLPENVGQSAARNRGVEAASGSVITMLDSDDLMLPGRIPVGLRHLEDHPHWVAVIGRVEMWIDEGVTPPPMVETEKENVELPKVMTGLIRRRAFEEIGGFCEDLRFADDVDFHFRLAALGEVGEVEALWGVRRIHGDNLVFDTEGIRRGMFQMMRNRRT